jgi:hypothetical protein
LAGTSRGWQQISAGGIALVILPADEVAVKGFLSVGEPARFFLTAIDDHR